MTWRDRLPSRRVTKTAETLARLDVMVEILTLATSRLEVSAKTLDDAISRHMQAMENKRGDDAET